MTYAGISTLFLRLIGFLAIISVLFTVLPAAFLSGPRSAGLLITGFSLIPGVLLIVASKPLGKLLAAGIE